MKYFGKMILSLAIILSACLPRSEPTAVPFDKTKLGTTKRNITYCTMQDVPLKMDIYYPPRDKKAFPVVIFVHGGGWSRGSKEGIPDFVDVDALRELGILTASIEYRLAPEYKFPAMIEDARCAVRFLRAHAAEFNLDPNRFGAIGPSAGGHLVSLLGLVQDNSSFDVGDYLTYSSRVQAVVDLYGPTNLEEQFARKISFDPLRVFGTTDRSDPVFAAASPVNHVSFDDASFLIIHANMDRVVPQVQSRMLFKALQEAGVPSELVIVTNAGHGLRNVGPGPIDPSLDHLRVKIQQFWHQHLLGD